MMIIGLPRSRTAWLSAFMSQSNTFFHHEAINGCESIDEYKRKTKNDGDSTTGFMFLLEHIKNKKTVIIKKSKGEIEDCISWADKAYGIDSRALIEDMSIALSGVKGLVINQSDIDSRLRDIWEFLVDDPWDDKYKNITSLNIQVKNLNIDEVAAKAIYETF